MHHFVLALTLFILLHIGVSATGLRAMLVKAMGEWPYRGLFSLASAVLLVWMIASFAALRADAPDFMNQPYWTPPSWLRHVAYLFIAAGMVLAVAGLATPGPTLTGFEKSLSDKNVVRGVLRITRHPFLWGVALWAAGHLMANDEHFAPVLFGGLGAMVLLGARSIDAKTRARDAHAWSRFAEATSNVPFAAIVQGRNKLVLAEMIWPLLLGVGAFVAMLFAHGALIGVPAVSIPS